MAKFVLHGGFNKEMGYIKGEFFQKALKDTGAEVKILLVFFAELPEHLEHRIQQCKDQFNNNKGAKNLEFKLATMENFQEGCAWADIIFLSGGRTVTLWEALKQFPNLKQLFENKTVVGDSAGVNVLGRLSYSRKTKEINKGLGILPYKILVHYSEEMGDPLADSEPDTETLFLREYETIVKYG